MLRFELSKIVSSTEKAVATGATVTAEGQALVNDIVNGGVKPSTGAANEQFAGMAMSQQLTPLALPKFDELTVSAGLTVALSFTPIGGTLRVYNVTKAAVVAAGAAAGNYAISGTTITIVAAGTTVAGDVLVIGYRFVPTTLQVKAVQGDIPPGGAAGSLLGTVGVITAGDLVTTEFDTTVDWSAVTQAAPIKLAANGLLTVGGAGGTVTGAYVTQLPTSASPYLGVHFSV